jgi:hypothetical protein
VSSGLWNLFKTLHALARQFTFFRLLNGAHLHREFDAYFFRLDPHSANRSAQIFENRRLKFEGHPLIIKRSTTRAGLFIFQGGTG